MSEGTFWRSAFTAALLCCAAVRADWNPGDYAKWAQLPDLTVNGMDVKATVPKILADDFLCTETSKITDIHFWGSWYGDLVNPNAAFKLSIHADIPDPDGTGPMYSRPGEELWYIVETPTVVRPYATVEPGEWWYDPNTGQVVPNADRTVWQYNFILPEAVAFLQQGTPANPVVYWLDIQAIFTGPEQWGWKTRDPLNGHFNDDAVWGDTPVAVWNELRYPSGHPYAGQSIDLAFVLTPEPGSLGVLALAGLLALRRR